MTSQPQPPTFRLEPTASPLRVGGRLAVLSALVAALAGGFVAGLAAPAPGAAGEVATTPPTCAPRPC